jgi:type II secretory pathway pseudopilin PulG
MKKSGGYMTVELLIAIIVGAILIGALNTIVVSHVHLSQRSRDLVIANAYAELKIESLRSAGFLTMTNGTSSVSNELPSELKAPRSATLTISSHTAATKKIHLSLTYNDQGTPRTHKYTTYIGELGVGQN